MKLFGKKLKINFNKFVTIVFLLWITLIYEGRHIPGSLWLAENTPLIIKLFVYLVMAFCVVLSLINWSPKRGILYIWIATFFISTILFVILFQNSVILFICLSSLLTLLGYLIIYYVNHKEK